MKIAEARVGLEVRINNSDAVTHGCVGKLASPATERPWGGSTLVRVKLNSCGRVYCYSPQNVDLVEQHVKESSTTKPAGTAYAMLLMIGTGAFDSVRYEILQAAVQNSMTSQQLQDHLVAIMQYDENKAIETQVHDFMQMRTMKLAPVDLSTYTLYLVTARGMVHILQEVPRIVRVETLSQTDIKERNAAESHNSTDDYRFFNALDGIEKLLANEPDEIKQQVRTHWHEQDRG